MKLSFFGAEDCDAFTDLPLVFCLVADFTADLVLVLAVFFAFDADPLESALSLFAAFVPEALAFADLA